MNADPLMDQIVAARRRLGALRERSRQPDPSLLLDESLEEAGVALEELRVAEEELRVQSEELEIARAATELARSRYEDLFENAPDPYLLTDAEGVILEVNRAGRELLGESTRSLVNRPLVLHVGAEDRSTFHNEISRVRRGETPSLSAIRLRTDPENEARWLTVRINVLRQAGREPRLRWLLRDVTGHRRAEEEIRRLNATLEERVRQRTAELEAASRRLQFVADAGRLFATSLDWRTTLAHLTTQAVPTLGDWSIVEAADADGVWRRYALELEPDQHEKLAIWERDHPPRTRTPDDIPSGALFVADSVNPPGSLTPAELEAIRPMAFIGWRAVAWLPLIAGRETFGSLWLGSREPGGAKESADRVVAEEFARQAAAALRNAELYRRVCEADRRKDEFLALLGHELRNPLAPIRNAIHVLERPILDQETANWARDMLHRQLAHLTRLIDDLLDVSRITRGKVLLRRQQLDLTDAVRKSVETTASAATARRLTLTASSLEGPAWIDADPARLEQILSNLLTNAVKYTEPGGSITVSLAIEGDEGVVRIRDTGVGIGPDLLPKVFDLFVQADRSLAHSQGGLGIGLAMVRHFVDLHGGTVTASSDGLGLGSEFTVRLPLSCAGVGTAELFGPNLISEPTRSAEVLVVDDNVDAAESLALLLRVTGHQVRVCHDGLKALAMVEESFPDVAVLDIGLPGLDGYSVARQLRQRAEGRTLLLVALTGYGQEEDRRRAMQAGFDHHLTKPVDPETLVRLVGEVPPRTEPLA